MLDIALFFVIALWCSKKFLVLGTGAIILVPTRELAMQTYGVLTELMKYNKHTYGLVMGGGSKSKETQKLFNGIFFTITSN